MQSRIAPFCVGWQYRTFRELPKFAQIVSCLPRPRLQAITPRTSRRTKTTLPDHPVRTRFAPSPTGALHLGSLRTALFNYLLARATSGQFLLRLEDTDAKRTIPGAEESIYADLRWAGLQWDEGPLVGGDYGPYRQSERTKLYHEAAEQLAANGHGYRCFCSQERLEDLAQRRKDLGLPTDYDRTCAGIPREESEQRAARGEKFVVRLRAPEAYPPFMDLVYGKVGRGGSGANAGVTHKHGEIAYEDPVLLKSDGKPTYHLANVVDDHAMNITHVVRATEWISSTPKHLALYDAFGWKPPAYAHVGLLVDTERRKLSKRAMDTGVAELRAQGWTHAALINFAALLGCSYERRGDVMDLDDMVKGFKMKFTKGDAVVAGEKLQFLQRAHVDRAVQEYVETGQWSEPLQQLVKKTSALAFKLSADQDSQSLTNKGSMDAHVKQILVHDARNFINPRQFYERNQFLFFQVDTRESQQALQRILTDARMEHQHKHFANSLNNFKEQLGRVLGTDTSKWAAPRLDALIRDASRDCFDQIITADGGPRHQEKQQYIFWCRLLRAAFVAGKHGPGVGATMQILGPETTLFRLDQAISNLREMPKDQWRIDSNQETS